MSKRIIIIGAGPGGYIAAIRAAQLGAEVTIIEQEKVGGTCLNWGCIPSKVMRTTAELLEKFYRAKEFGIEVNGSISPDINALMARKQTVIQNQIKGILKLLAHHKIHYLEGNGTIVGPNRAVVKHTDGTTRELSWDRLILALGSRPANIASFPFDGMNILSSNDVLNLREIPRSVLIVGGGVIGCEFAFILSFLGSEVTVVETLSRMLPIPSVDQGCSKVLEREMKKHRIRFIVNHTVSNVKEAEGKCRVSIAPSQLTKKPEQKGENPLTIEVDKIIVCIGRTPNTGGVGLEKIGVNLDENGWIVTNKEMKTGASDVYAAGDVIGPSRPMLAHVASKEGSVAAENAMGESKTINYDVVPGVTFTMPEVANVGLTEAQARDQGYNVRSDRVLFRNLGKAHVMGEIAGEAKIVSDAEKGKILGVHIVGPHASDLIAEGTLAIQARCTVKELAETMHAHPTLAEIMLEVSLKALGRSLHG
jgi:dihydrolipoamide dehydrogenase